jgi:nuclear GTP-binding protein
VYLNPRLTSLFFSLCPSFSNYLGETRVWQYITLFKRVFLIDCPGVVYGNLDTTHSHTSSVLNTETNAVLKGVVRVENLEDPAQYVDGVLERVKRVYMERTYNVKGWETAEEFLEKLAISCGKLLKGGDPDLNTVARMVLNDWQRGRIPFFVPPPFEPEVEAIEAEKERNRQIKESPYVPQVHQLFNKINVKMDYDDADAKAPEADFDDAIDNENIEDVDEIAYSDGSDVEAENSIATDETTQGSIEVVSNKPLAGRTGKRGRQTEQVDSSGKSAKQSRRK